jgi:hypothetical protein
LKVISEVLWVLAIIFLAVIYSRKLSIASHSKNPEGWLLFDPSHSAKIAIQRPLLNLPENLLRETSISNHPLYMVAVGSPGSTISRFNLLV